MKTLVVKLGGSLVVPDGIDIDFLRKFKELASEFVKKGNRLAVIVGGGKTCRRYQDASAEFGANDKERDWVGIYSTWLNARLVKAMFSDLCKDEVIMNYENLKVGKGKVIIGGGGVPGHSTDMDAAKLAKHISAEAVIKLTDQYFVFTADPRKDKNAKPLTGLNWKEYLKIIGEEWMPGLSTPFDPVASKEAMHSGLKVIITKGSDLENLKQVLYGKEFKGTVIK